MQAKAQFFFTVVCGFQVGSRRALTNCTLWHYQELQNLISYSLQSAPISFVGTTCLFAISNVRY